MEIPFFDYPALYGNQRERLDAVLEVVLKKGAYILQEELEEFEKSLAENCGIKHAVGVANGTDALWLSLMAAGVGLGDEIVLPSHTYVASAAAVKMVGATPVLVECGPDHLLDPDDIERVLTDKSRVIMPVQLNGRTGRMDQIQEIAAKHDLIIIEDAAQGLGSKYKGKMAGTFGLAGTYSFYPAKVLGCFGDGGAVVTNNDQLAERIRMLRNHGLDGKGEYRSWGFNSRLDNLQAAVLLEKLKSFDQDIARRREIAGIYQDRLGDLENLVLPPPPARNGDHFDTYQNYEIECERRDQLQNYLAEQGVGTLIQWGGQALHQIEALGFKDTHLPFTDRVFTRCLMLPLNTALTNAEVAYICDQVRRFYQRQ